MPDTLLDGMIAEATRLGEMAGKASRHHTACGWADDQLRRIVGLAGPDDAPKVRAAYREAYREATGFGTRKPEYFM